MRICFLYLERGFNRINHTSYVHTMLLIRFVSDGWLDGICGEGRGGVGWKLEISRPSIGIAGNIESVLGLRNQRQKIMWAGMFSCQGFYIKVNEDLLIKLYEIDLIFFQRCCRSAKRVSECFWI